MEVVISETPSWGRLYALATLALGLLGVADTFVPAGAWRRTVEVVITVVAFGAIHLWVRGNRRALDLAGARDSGFRRVVDDPDDLNPVRRGRTLRVPQPHITDAKTAMTQAGRRGTVVALPRR